LNVSAETVSEIETAAPGGFKPLEAEELGDLYRPAEGPAAAPAVSAAALGPLRNAPEEAAADAPSEAAVVAEPLPSVDQAAARLRQDSEKHTAAGLRRAGKAAAVRGLRKRTLIAAAALLLLGGGLILARQPVNSRNPAVLHFKLSATSPAEVRAAAPAAPPIAWEAVFAEVDELRRVLGAKRAEVERMIRTCRFGVLENEEELAAIIQRLGAPPPAAAQRDRRVEFLIHGIQRRQAYLDAMEQPLDRLEAASEELLYLRRRAAIDLELRAVSDRDGLEELHRRLRAVMAEVPGLLRDLSLEVEGPYPSPSMDAIWKRALERARAAASLPADERSEAITEEICSGDLARAAELPRLSLRAARCLAESPARDLVLSGASELSPHAAMRLREWPGEWLSLNALKRVTPESARHLFAWAGVRLSLNGLRDLPAEAARYVPGWEGRHLELMGLEGGAGLHYLAQWEEAGGTLYVSEKVRREMQALRSRTLHPAAPRR
jgi:hypothetical protein